MLCCILSYKQRVAGSNPAPPTPQNASHRPLPPIGGVFCFTLPPAPPTERSREFPIPPLPPGPNARPFAPACDRRRRGSKETSVDAYPRASAPHRSTGRATRCPNERARFHAPAAQDPADRAHGNPTPGQDVFRPSSSPALRGFFRVQPGFSSRSPPRFDLHRRSMEKSVRRKASASRWPV